MKESRFFVYPTSYGYKFDPPEFLWKSEILPLLIPVDDRVSNNSAIFPFVRACWVGSRLYFVKTRAAFLVGVTSHGIPNELHRGSYSTWAAGCIIESKKPFAANETRSILESLFGKFRAEVTARDSTKSCFSSAIIEGVLKYVSKEATEAAIASIDSLVVDEGVASKMNYSPLLNPVSWLSCIKKIPKNTQK